MVIMIQLFPPEEVESISKWIPITAKVNKVLGKFERNNLEQIL
jgi:hypothetical protein